jgi:hypothetical protein
VYSATSDPYGLLVLDTSDFDNPMVLGASRTVSYVSKLVREGQGCACRWTATACSIAALQP